MREIEYFCTLRVERKVPGGTVQELEDVLVYTNTTISTAQDIYFDALNQVFKRLTQYGENKREDITVLDFNFWRNELDEKNLRDA